MAAYISRSSNDTLDFSDAEIRSELSRLGYNEIDPQQFDEFKRDLITLVQADKSSSFASQASSGAHPTHTKSNYTGRYDQLYRPPYESAQDKENLDSVTRSYSAARERVPLSTSNADYRTASSHIPSKPSAAWSKSGSAAAEYRQHLDAGARSLPMSSHRKVTDYYKPVSDEYSRPRSADGVRRYSDNGRIYDFHDSEEDSSRMRHLDDHWYRGAGDEETYTSDNTTQEHRRLYTDDYTTASELADQSPLRDERTGGDVIADSFNDKLDLSKASQSSSIVKRKVSRRMSDGTSRVYEESYVQDDDCNSDDGSIDSCEDRLHQVGRTKRGVLATGYINEPDRVSEPINGGTSRQEKIAARSRATSARYDKTVDPVKSAVIWPEPKAPVSRMKTDPVNRYQQYQEQWNKTKVPEEKKHKMLRWTVREQMLYKDIIYEKPQKKYVENKYVVPTDKKRKDLRWRIRADMAAGILPSSS